MSTELLPPPDDSHNYGYDPVMLGSAYAGFFQTIADRPSGMTLATVRSTASTIYSLDPYSRETKMCGRDYERYFYHLHGAHHEGVVVQVDEDSKEAIYEPGDTILAPVIRSYAQTGLAFNSELIVRAANRLGPNRYGIKWVTHVLKEHLEELRSEDNVVDRAQRVAHVTMALKAVRKQTDHAPSKDYEITRLRAIAFEQAGLTVPKRRFAGWLKFW